MLSTYDSPDEIAAVMWGPVSFLAVCSRQRRRDSVFFILITAVVWPQSYSCLFIAGNAEEVVFSSS